MDIGIVNKLLGNVNVFERNNEITVRGIPTKKYFADLSKIWGTSKIHGNMFTYVSSSTITFHRFFLIEVVYTLTMIVDSEIAVKSNRRLLNKIIDALKMETWYRKLLQKHPSILDYKQLDRLNVDLFKTQRGFLEVYDEMVPKLDLRGYMLAADPGTGKTINGLALGVCLKADVIIVITEKRSLDRVWQPTVASIFKEPITYWISNSGDPLVHGKYIYVFHYEQLERALQFFKGHQYKKPLIILDESHNLNDIKSLRTLLYIELCNDVMKAKHILPMSGTPIKAIGKEAVPLLKTIDPYFDDKAEVQFIKIFGLSSSKALDILSHRLGHIVHKVKKSDVVTNEIERIEVSVVVPNGEKYTLEAVSQEMGDFIRERMEYYRTNFSKYEAIFREVLKRHEELVSHNPKELAEFQQYIIYLEAIRSNYIPEQMQEESRYCNWYEEKKIMPYLRQPMRDEFKNAKSVVKYYDLKVQGEALGRILGKRRMECNVAIASHFEFEEHIETSRKKTVIFTSYVEVVDKVFSTLTKQGYKPLRVYGATNHDLGNIIKKFEQDEDANPLIATFQSLSTAVPLVMASTEIILNKPFRSKDLDQTEARIDRVGQDGPIKYVYVSLDTGGEPNLSTRTNDILEWSRSQVEKIMGEKVHAEDDIVLEAYNYLNDASVLALEDIKDVYERRVVPSSEVNKIASSIYSW